ncbi:hypothetical protein PDG61_20295 [Mycolicibacterium sp. BiH015]|uniref:hypothetical protein n=1 Tax=Mycolicibacterium sp. BiH015 TaxID=3018808 RepID=UPI0022DFC937|nr:hypothetical protein [Mycolicibacterium sp. BiH015]MDA2893272.1 hypothetical protein [Mycolicibacterium sp. BiH015]
MVEDGLAEPEAWQAIRAQDEQFLGRYELSAEELRLVRSHPTPDKLAASGMPPLLAMWGSFMWNPEFEQMMSAGEYFTATDEGER